MSFALLMGSLVIGLNLACFYLLMALGLTLMFGICGIVNMAHGVFYMLGAFGTFYLNVGLSMNFFASLALVLIAGGIAGLLMERGIFRKIGGEFAPTIVTTVGFLILIESIGYLLFGTEARGMPAPVEGVSKLLGINIATYRIAIYPITAALAFGLYLFIQRTKLGLAMRATEEDKVATALQGVNPDRVNSMVFFIGFALAATAGGLIGPVYSISPSMGSLPLLKAFMVIILGGMGSISGAIVGSIAIGLMDAFLSVMLGSELSYIIAWLVVIAVLIFRPHGLFGAY